MQSTFETVFSTARYVLTGVSVLAGAFLAGPAQADHDGRPVKIMIINMFGGPFPSEAAAFTGNLHLTETIHVRGLSPDYPNILCNSDDVCQMIAGEGHANVTASTMALALTEPGPAGKMPIYGVVRLISDANNERGEYAVVVQDDLTGKGLGMLLMKRIIDYAKSRGIQEITGHVLAENTTMLKLCEELGFSIEREIDDASGVRVRLKLG